MKSLKFANIKKDTRVFVRCDLDVPLKDNTILDDFRLQALLPSLKYIISHGGIPVIAGHLGRPKGTYNKNLSTDILKEFFNFNLGKDKYVLLENLRFDKREKENDVSFAKELAAKADIYVNESFATCHREHASIVSVPTLLPSYAGLHLEKEVKTLKDMIEKPRRPFVAVIGGAKVESKGPVIKKLLGTCDFVLVGGKIALEYKDFLNINNPKLKLATGYIPSKLDISQETIKEFNSIIKTANSIIWAGPMGLYEEGYTKGTKGIAESIVNSNAFSIIGGGDTVADVRDLGLSNKFSFVSTGGGAMLDFLIKGTLPGLKVLNYENS